MEYNNWLREVADKQQDMLLRSMDKLPAQLSALQSVLLQGEISSVRLTRVCQAMTHLVNEIHLLVISTGVTK